MAIRHSRMPRLILPVLVLLFWWPGGADAQYFGRNKVQYDKFDFKVLATPHFDIYYYPVEAAAAAEAGRMAERWYGRLSRLFGHTLSSRQAVVLYASHPDFEQTNVIEGQLDEGTGGVTEGARRRVVLPMAATLADSDHVLGHELVHAFQYDILGQNAGAMPLWFIEGMAEYLSLGPRSTQTSMWLRDAAIQDRLPRIADLDDPRYFPYRFGHGLWAFVGGRLGDRVIADIMGSLSPLSGNDRAGAGDAIGLIEQAFSEEEEAISQAWHTSIRELYGITPAPTRDAPPSEAVVIGERTGSGTLNVGPALSPDGNRIAFLSARDLLSIDLFLADARTGRVERRLIRTAGDPHFESLQFLASAGAWAPDGRQLAVATVRQGRPALAIIDTERADVTDEIRLPDLGEVFQPSWSPDGQSIAFSAQVGGVTDLFIFDLKTRQTRRLTSDAFGDLQPVWSPDGRRLAFVTDRYHGDLAQLHVRGTGLALIDVATGTISRVETGLGDARLLDPKWAPDGRVLYFVSDAHGKPNVYRLDLAAAQAVQVTDVATGIAGVTPTSPAWSLAANGSRAAVTLFTDGGFEIQFLDPAALRPVVAAEPVRDYAALPPSPRSESAVAAELAAPGRDLPPVSGFDEAPYESQIALVGVGQEVGVAASSAFGTYINGGIALQFSDILGNHLIGTSFGVNGGIRDISASATYLNRTSRWNWAVFGERLPLLSGSATAGQTIINGQPVFVEETQLFRQTYTRAGVMAAYPLSRSSRVEFGTSASHIGFSREVHTAFFDPFSGALLGREEQDLDSEPGVRLYDVSTAFVRDTSSFGPVSPLLGQRFRAEIAPTTGDLKMTNLTLDFRQYAMPVRPLTFAVRGLHVARYGGSGEDERLTPMFIGYSTLVRGYDPNSFEVSECTVTATGSCLEFDRLAGSRIAVINAEARIPALGFGGDLNYGPIPIELFGFFDAGVAWTRDATPSFVGGTRDWVSSAGIGARVNALGFLIAEFNLAKPLNRDGRGWMFVFNFRPGF